jgi:hypothetical protein
MNLPDGIRDDEPQEYRRETHEILEAKQREIIREECMKRVRAMRDLCACIVVDTISTRVLDGDDRCDLLGLILEIDRRIRSLTDADVDRFVEKRRTQWAENRPGCLGR